MKVSVNWLKEYVDIDLSVDALVEKIGSQLGEVEEVVDLGKKYAGIKIVKVMEVKKHPNADKLTVCQIDTGKEKVQVVCGAPNVREGMLAAWIPPGNTVPATAGSDPFVLEAREIRGEVSNGMLASSSELTIGDDHSGIVDLEKGKAGDDFARVYELDDHIISIENKMFTHRPDCFGIVGVAREVAGILGKNFVSPDWYAKTPKFVQASGLDLEIENQLPKLVPRFMAVAIKGVEIKPSTFFNQTYLAKVGIRPINNIVDLTNLFMYLSGQPLHAYDYDKVAARSKNGAKIVVRYPKKAEKLKLLGGKTIEPHPQAVMIASDKELVGIGGVMGGADTEVSKSTKNIIFECANFDLYSVRKTSMEHGLFTDAVTRFSKGQSPLQNDRVLAATMRQLIDNSGATQASKVIDDEHIDREVRARESFHEPVKVSAGFISQRLGVKLGAGDIVSLLKNVEFTVEVTRGDVLIVKAPFWRTDIEIAEDVVEEVGRLYGYDRLPQELPKRSSAPATVSPMLQLKQTLAEELSALGANEVLTYSFVHEKLLKAASQDPKEAFKINNALSPDLQYYRLSLSPSLLEKVHPNIKAGFDSFALFELGKVHGKSETGDDGLPKELDRLCLVLAEKQKRGSAAYFRAQAVLAAVLENRFDTVKLVPLRENKIKDHKMFNAMLAPFDPDRAALVFVNDKLLGVVGEYKQPVVSTLKLPVQTAGFELFLNPMSGQKQSGYMALSRYPSITQDITLKTDHKLEFSQIFDGLDASLGKHKPDDVVISTECIDIFSKDKTHKNTTFRIVAFSYDRTLTTEVLSSVLDKVEADVKKSINAIRI